MILLISYFLRISKDVLSWIQIYTRSYFSFPDPYTTDMLLIIFENFLNTKVKIQHNRDTRDAGPILGGGNI